MTRTLSPELIEAMNARDTAEVVLVLLTISEASLPAPIRVVNNNDAIVSNGETFQPFYFEPEFPSERGDVVDTVRIRIDNVDLSLMELIRTAQGKPELKMQVVLASNPDNIEVEYEFELDTTTADMMSITGTLVYDDVGNYRFPAHQCTGAFFPDLF